mgnify:CR=1 FL=1
MRFSPQERKPMAILFCATVPERLVNAFESVVRFPERLETVEPSADILPESALIFAVLIFT